MEGEVGQAAEDTPQAEIDSPPAACVAAGLHEVRARLSGGFQEPGHVPGVVGEVSVHGQHMAAPIAHRSRDAIPEGRAQALLPRPVDQRDVAVVGAQLPGCLGGAVGAAIVDDVHMGTIRQGQRFQGIDKAGKVPSLVVGRDDDTELFQRPSP